MKVTITPLNSKPITKEFTSPEEALKFILEEASRPTKRAPDARKSAPKNRSKNKKGSAKPARG